MRRRVVSAAMLALLSATAVQAQRVDVIASAVAVTNSEITGARQARGLGVMGGVGLTRGRLRVEARALTASLQADFSVQPDYALHQLELNVTYLWRPGVGFELGGGRRFVAPDFAAQDVGVIRVGAVTETSLSSLARIEGRVAYLPLTAFSGGGDSGAAVELGLGLRLGQVDRPWAGVVGFSYQRLDRTVDGASAPVRFSVGHVGIGRRL